MNLQDQIRLLHEFSACDVSDALLKLQNVPAGQVSRAGYLADVVPFAPASPRFGNIEQQPKIIAPASTVKLVPKGPAFTSLPNDHPGAIPKGAHWVDLTEKGTMVVIEQPPGQTCAAIGGIMATRMKIREVAGCLVGGRVRDLIELRSSSLPIWGIGVSTVGTGAESKVIARNIPVSICGVVINPGDIIFCDPIEGVVSIPRSLLQPVLDMMPKLVAADDRVKEAVLNGSSVFEAFARHRN